MNASSNLKQSFFKFQCALQRHAMSLLRILKQCFPRQSVFKNKYVLLQSKIDKEYKYL